MVQVLTDQWNNITDTLISISISTYITLYKNLGSQYVYEEAKKLNPYFLLIENSSN